MLCQKCGLAPATVHRYSKAYRQQVEEHLCAICAGEMTTVELHNGPWRVSSEHCVPVTTDSPSDSSPATRLPLQTIEINSPIIVRDLAAALGVAPFKLISALNSLVGFAAIHSTTDDAVAKKVAARFGYHLTKRHE